MYQHNGVHFDFPEFWEVVDDDGDDIIRAITVECPNNGYYTMDIYNSGQVPSLGSYIKNSLEYFINELPFGYKVIDEPIQTVEKATFKKSGVEGISLAFTVRTLFRKKINYIHSYFIIDSGVKYKVIDEPIQTVEKATFKKSEVEGISLAFTVRTLFRKKINYIHSYFIIDS